MQNIADYLSKKSYPGRGIALGANKNTDKLFIAYFIMGRSENSRNRIFSQYGLDIRTEAFDPSLVSDPSLIFYTPVKHIKDKFIIVSNGGQTDTVYEYLKEKKSFEDALKTRSFEPDAPNFTPRISLLLNLCDYSYKMSIIKADKRNMPVHLFFDYKPQALCSRLIHTYSDDGKPLPSFEGEPALLKSPDNFEDFTKEIWENLNKDNKISLFTECIDTKTKEITSKIINTKGNTA